MNRLSVVFKIKSYISLLLFFLMIYVGAFLSVCFVSVFIWYKLIAAFFWAGSLYLSLKNYIPSVGSCAVVEFGLAVGEDNRWFLKDGLGRWHLADINGAVFVSNLLVVVNFFVDELQCKKSVIIFWNSLDKGSFRKLKFIIATH